MVTIEQVEFPYFVTIPVSLADSASSSWYDRVKHWLTTNIAAGDWEIVEESAWRIVVTVRHETDALLIKIGWESGEDDE